MILVIQANDPDSMALEPKQGWVLILTGNAPTRPDIEQRHMVFKNRSGHLTTGMGQPGQG
jgi:hypothetical protein